MSVDPTQIVTFDKSIIISLNEAGQQSQTGTAGQLRFNQTTLKFEGYHTSNGALLGEIWRPLTQDIATASNLGVFKVGTNLLMNPSTGILSSIATGTSRIHALVIEVSPILGAADYQTINDAITQAIGTSVGGYIDGSITSNLGSPPSATWPFVIQLSPGQYSESSNQIILPDYVSIRGEDNYNSVITQNAGNVSVSTGAMIIAGQNSEIRNLVVKLADSNTTSYSTAVYIANKSNVVVDSCIFEQTSTCNSTLQSTSIYITASNTSYNNSTNQIINN